MDLSAFLDRAAKRSITPGEHDCLHWLADWCLILTGVDPAGPWRGRHRTPLAQARFLKRQGGVLAFVERQALAAGLLPCAAPRAGAVGVVQVSGPDGRTCLVGAISTGPQWAVLREPRGLIVSDPPALGVWALRW